MRRFVEEVLVPYFEAKRKVKGYPDDLKAIWVIDCWSVHRSEEFCRWMAENHPNIILLYIPANCTGIFQPCDVGMQRPLKLLLKRFSLEDVVEEVSKAFE
ncbi:hypothetical protein M422DRAFT_102736, partial [Sphaerobolus stellatus SS14]